MKENIVVHSVAEVPTFLPKLENPVYKLAMSHKIALREEALNRIMMGEFEALAPLVSAISPITYEEKIAIAKVWRGTGNRALICSYFDYLVDGKGTIEEADAFYQTNYLKIEKNKGRA